MVVRTKERPLSTRLEFKANSTKRVEIDRDNLIRRINMLFKIVLASGVTPGTVPLEDDILNLVKKIRLVMDADDNKFNVDLLKWSIVEEIEKGAPVPRDALVIPPTVTTGAALEILVTADFAQRRQDLSDTSALLDAPNKSSLFLEVDWGDISNILGTVADTTVDATTEVEITLVEVFDDAGADANAELAGKGFIDIREGIDEFIVTKANTSFDDSTLQEQIEPTPANILTHLLITKINQGTATEARDNGVITQLKVENIKGVGEKIIQTAWQIAHLGNKQEYGLERVFTGAFYIDWIDQRRGGLRNFVAEAIKWRFLTAAPTGTTVIQIFTRYVSGRGQ